MTSLTVPEGQLWVNLSPYEKDRIIDDRFGLTDMGRDLLAQDYILKQITASLIFPEEGTGKEFWAEVYSRAQDEFGTTDIPVDTFNKVWIMPDVAEVYQKGTSAMVLKAHLKVMLESDYLAIENNVAAGGVVPQESGPSQELTKQILRKIIVPVLEKEVNEGKNFSRLRQIYNALILAAWYKKTMRESFLGKAYVDQSKVKGIEQPDPADNQKIYNQYVDAFYKGVFNYVKEEIDGYNNEVIPRKYFSGGIVIPTRFSQDILVVRRTIDGGQGKDFAEKPVAKVSLTLERIMKEVEDLPLALDKIFKLNKAYLTLYNSKPDELFSTDEREALKSYESALVSLSKEYIEEVLSGETETKEVVMKEIVEPFLSGGWSSGRSLLFSGVYTDQVSRYFLALAKLARKDSKVPFLEVLDLLGLPVSLKMVVARKIEALKSVADYQAFYESFFQEVFSKDSVFKDEGYTAVGKLTELRESSRDVKDVYWRQKLAAAHDSRNKKLVNDMIAYQRSLFPFSSLRVLNIKKDALTFVRVKSYPSIMGKLYRDYIKYQSETFESERKTLSFSDFFDLTGGKLVVKGPLSKVEQQIEEFDAQCIKYDLWERNMKEKEEDLKVERDDLIIEKQELMQEKAALRKEKGKNKSSHDKLFRKIEEDYIKREAAYVEAEENLIIREEDLKYKRSNLIDSDGKYILFRKENRYVSGLGDEKGGHYKGTNYVIAMGDGKNTIEVQFHGFLTMLYDIDHERIYKLRESGLPPIQLKDDLLKTIWLSHIVEGFGYMYKKDSKKVKDFLGDSAEAVRPGDDAVGTMERRDTGGIDVRGVQDALDVKGSSGRFDPDVLQEAGAVLGFSPQILSVTPVKGLPFLQEQSPPRSVFSKN
jgi:hypothetical protein